MTNRILKILNTAMKQFSDYAENYADVLTDKANAQCMSLMIKDFNDELAREQKCEAFVRRGADKLHRISIKALKKELKARAKQRKRELAKLAVQTKYASVDDVTVVENFAQCDDCIHRMANDRSDYCCDVYNIVFKSDELRKQFCSCFCTACEQRKDLTNEDVDDALKNSDMSTDKNADNVTEEKEPTDETTTPTEDKTPDDVADEETDDEPKCCKECEALIDGADGYYCNKYGKYLNDSDVENICCCENDDFFDEDEEE